MRTGTGWTLALLAAMGCSEGSQLAPVLPGAERPKVTITPVSNAAEPPAKTEESAAPVAVKSEPANDPLEKAETVASSTGIDWPNWRGPKGDGISSEKGWSAEWPEKGPPKLWSAAVGTGFSSVSVADGKLYTMGHKAGNDTVFCLNAETGKEIWRHSYPCKIVDNLHEGGPAATPTVDENRVFTVSKEGHLFALDAQSGKVLWKAALETLLEVEMPDWGFSCSPLVFDQQLIVEAGRTVAFDKATGNVLWKTEKFHPGYGSPAVLRTADAAYFVVLNNDCLLLVRAADGAEVARFPWETSFLTSSTTPIVSGNKIFISTGYNRGCALLEFKAGKLAVVYENKSMRNHMNNCLLWEGHLYGIDGNSHARRLCNLVAMNFETGAEDWKESGLGCGSLLLADGKLIVLSDDGELVVAPVSPTEFKPLSRAKVLSGRCWTVPVLSHGRIYCRNAQGDLVCLDVRL